MVSNLFPLTSVSLQTATSKPMFDFENDANARRLRDKAMAEHAKYVERKAAENRAKAEERKRALEERRKALAEKNRLAAINEQMRREREEEARQRSEKAIENLIESRKRRRR